MKAAPILQTGTEELGRPVRLEPGGSVADVGIGGSMSLIKAVAGKGLHLFPERVCLCLGERRARRASGR